MNTYYFKIKLWSNKAIQKKIDYVHNNPVEEGLVYKAEDYVYSRAIDSSGQKELVDEVIVL
ncbi:transposase, partial [Flavobacterium sp. ALJ2]|nr:transposase [Flavobacterium sp. ALJ2]